MWGIIKEDPVNLDLLRTALQANANPNPGPSELAPLLLMAWRGNADALQALLDAGATVDAASTVGAEKIPGNWDEVDKAIVSGGGTALILAAKKGNAAASRVLVKAGGRSI